MKYVARVLLVLFIAAGIVAFGYYKLYYIKPVTNTETLTTAENLESKKSSEKRLISSLKDDNIYLYYSDDGTVTLKQDSQETEFKNWNENIGKKSPKMVYWDFDNDKQNELCIFVYTGQDSYTKKDLFDIYMLEVTKDKDKKYSYRLSIANSNTFADLINGKVLQELSQTKVCHKRLQFGMNKDGATINYDKKTGIAKSGYIAYITALKEDNKYLTLEKWTKGGCYCGYENSNLYCKIDVIAYYKNSEKTQLVGQINYRIMYQDGHFNVSNNSLYFKTAKEYSISKPNKKAVANWNYKIKNTYVDKTSTTIDNINNTFALDSGNEKSISFYGTDSTKYIDSVVIYKNKAVITSSNSFDESLIKGGNYSVTINKGKSNEYEISYTAAVTKKNNKSILTINFDKDYSKSEISTITINLGNN